MSRLVVETLRFPHTWKAWGSVDQSGDRATAEALYTAVAAAMGAKRVRLREIHADAATILGGVL